MEEHTSKQVEVLGTRERRVGMAGGTLAFALWLCGCARPPAAYPVDDVDREAVVHLSSECSGTLIAPAWVLTAAHCVLDLDELPFVHAAGRRRAVRECIAHPGAYGSSRCGERIGATESLSHDMALLRLADPVRASEVQPLPVQLGRGPSYAWWLSRPVLLIGWSRRPVIGATVRSYGWNRVSAVFHGRLLTRSAELEPTFEAQGGNSGAPALMRIDRDERVVGVLSSTLYGTHGRRYSVHSATFVPSNARWIRGTLQAHSD